MRWSLSLTECLIASASNGKLGFPSVLSRSIRGASAARSAYQFIGHITDGSYPYTLGRWVPIAKGCKGSDRRGLFHAALYELSFICLPAVRDRNGQLGGENRGGFERAVLLGHEPRVL